MNQLMKVQVVNNRPTILARDLYEFLQMEERFSRWFERMKEYGFEEGADYTPYQFIHPQNNQEFQDYQLTLAMAKEICMLQRNDKGKEARQYFIKLEEAWNSPERVMARALTIANKTITELEIRIKQDEPKVLFANSLIISNKSILIGELAKILNQNGFEIGQNRLFEYLRKNSYLLSRGDYYNMPSQYSMELGLFEIKKSTITNSDGSIRTTTTTKVTAKGQEYFINHFLKKKKEEEELQHVKERERYNSKQSVY